MEKGYQCPCHIVFNCNLLSLQMGNVVRCAQNNVTQRFNQIVHTNRIRNQQVATR